MHSQERVKTYIELLYHQYNVLLLSKKEVSSITGKSIATLDRLRARGLGPPYIKEGTSKNGSVSYSIHSIASWLVSQETVKTF